MNIETHTPDPQIATPITSDTELRPVPLADCVLSTLNPRQQAGDLGIDALAASIRAVGLLQNLAGWQPDGTTVEIVAGGRRLRALQQLADEDGRDPATILIPVRIAVDEAEARQMASTENVARMALHPADEIVAYRNLHATGMAPADIAKAFAVTERQVRGRLRLADLSDPILVALRADEITLDVAAAYTVNADPVAQAAVFEELHGTWGGDNPAEIKHRLTSDSVISDNKLARFVGRAAYEEAGGDVHEDLFGTDCYFTDPALLLRLAEEKLRNEVEALKAAGWAWVTATIERPSYEVTGAMARTYPERVVATDEEAERYDVLADLIEADEASDDEIAVFGALVDRLDAEVYTDTQMDHAGVFLWIDWNGDIGSAQGYVRAEDHDAAVAAGVCKPRLAPTPTRSKPKGPYSQALLRDLAHIRTAAFQSAMLQAPELALDLLTFVLVEQLPDHQAGLGITTDVPTNAPEHDPGLKLPKTLKDQQSKRLYVDTDLIDAFTTFRRRKPATKSRLLTEAVARLLSIGLSDDASPFAEHLAREAGIEVRSIWTPTEAFLSRLRKGELLSIHQEIMGNPAPSTTLGKQSKAEIAAWLGLIFSGGHTAPNISQERQKRADAWLPKRMASVSEKPGDPEPAA